jgi:hypothetical protein
MPGNGKQALLIGNMGLHVSTITNTQWEWGKITFPPARGTDDFKLLIRSENALYGMRDTNGTIQLHEIKIGSNGQAVTTPLTGLSNLHPGDIIHIVPENNGSKNEDTIVLSKDDADHSLFKTNKSNQNPQETSRLPVRIQNGFIYLTKEKISGRIMFTKIEVYKF